MDKQYDDSKWKEEYKNFVSDKYRLGLLEKGAKSIQKRQHQGKKMQNVRKFCIFFPKKRKFP